MDSVLTKYLINNNIDDLNQESLSAVQSILQEFSKTSNHKLLLKNLNVSDIDLCKILLKIIFIFSKSPFTTQEEVARKFNFDKEELKIVNLILRNSNLAQKLITTQGIAKKHWQNTIGPVAQSGALKSNVDNNYQFPFRIGLYPGLSCMFECSFCGRNYDAVYKRSALDSGMEAFNRLIEEAPTNDPNRFYISGGLEPLTNPKIGQLIKKLNYFGLKSSMYSNGFMLTENYVKKNTELYNLDSLRISFYGTDSEKTFSVTKKKNAYEIVTKNISSYLKNKSNYNTNQKFGLNFVILKGHAKDVLHLVDLISNINKSPDLQGSKINFLTLREDFRLLGQRINEEDKNQLIEVLQEVEKKIKIDPNLRDLYVDYGFALEPLKNGYKEEKFDNIVCTYDEMKIVGTPQISVVVDLYGDVYLWREAGFLDRPGVKRYIIGNVIKEGSMQKIIQKYVDQKPRIEVLDDDRDYLDAWDHVVVKLVNQSIKDKDFGIPFEEGPIANRIFDSNAKNSLAVHFSAK